MLTSCCCWLHDASFLYCCCCSAAAAAAAPLLLLLLLCRCCSSAAARVWFSLLHHPHTPTAVRLGVSTRVCVCVVPRLRALACLPSHVAISVCLTTSLLHACLLHVNSREWRGGSRIRKPRETRDARGFKHARASGALTETAVWRLKDLKPPLSAQARPAPGSTLVLGHMLPVEHVCAFIAFCACGSTEGPAGQTLSRFYGPRGCQAVRPRHPVTQPPSVRTNSTALNDMHGRDGRDGGSGTDSVATVNVCRCHAYAATHAQHADANSHAGTWTECPERMWRSRVRGCFRPDVALAQAFIPHSHACRVRREDRAGMLCMGVPFAFITHPCACRDRRDGRTTP